MQSDAFLCGCSHSQANTAEVPNHLHSLTLIAQIFKILQMWIKSFIS